VPGFFVAIEGIDGAGTTTQTSLVSAQLQARFGLATLATREPSDLRVGLLARSLLIDRSLNEKAMALLFAADRLDHYDVEIRPALAAGKIVVSDRYLLSSLVYQGEFASEDWVAEINRFAPEPDLTVFIDVDTTLAAQRRLARGGGEERYEASALQARLVQRYHRLVQTLEKKLIVSGAEPSETIADTIAKVIAEKVQG
jgi:dTMP kinase